MKIDAFVCNYCGAREEFDSSGKPRSECLPLGWAAITYDRQHNNEREETLRTTASAHACEACAEEVLLKIDPPRPTEVAA